MAKHIIVAPKAGFCLGVSLALKKLDNCLAKAKSKPITTLGPIIHNPQVLEKYQKQGVIIKEDYTQIKTGETVLIRAHGVPKEVEDYLRQKQVKIIDATCPKVKKAQILIRKYTQNAILLLYGEREHPEVKGLISYAQNQVVLFESLEQLRQLRLDPQKFYVLASQTTQNQEEFKTIQNYLYANQIRPKIINTICTATAERQAAALQLAQTVDFMIVIGGKMSGNTRRLAQIVAQYVPTVHIETAQELSLEMIAPYNKIGLTAGASTPQSIIEEVQTWLKTQTKD